ncbi:hypothetical protein B5E77_03890 [Lachnoclostridium sp. An131]|uniref:lipopolysaccharide biosynthesis protein n=1 Tax=Lachnoclostridium sp. An131 TaxID=1965555 RepID=UPI000B37732F|nr:oligosaccharide flippase family protein [Lachnoclostridium sp. An131]OUQ27967.1 hypothetical protein B5E77_03890 [Lachnoclostridium sp. An131]
MKISPNSGNKKMLGNSIFYALADLLSKGLHFLLLPIYTFYLSPTDYGIQNIITGFNSVVSYIILLCLDSALIKFYSDFKEEKKTMKRVYGTSISIVFISSLATLCVCVYYRNILCKTVFNGISFVPYILLGIMILVLDSFYTLHRRMLEAQQKGRKVAIISILTVVCSSLITIIMIGVLKKGVVGLLFATALTSAGTVVFMIVDMINNDMIEICFDLKLAKKMLSYSLPLIPHQISGYLATFIAKVFLNISNDLSVVGLYGIATQISSVVDVFQDAFSRAYRPWLFERLKKPADLNKFEISNMSSILLSFYSVVFILIGLFAQEIIFIMTSPKYYLAWKVIPILIVAISLRSIYYFYIAQCMYYEETAKKIFLASVTANLCNIIVTAIAVPYLGMYGSAIASLVSIIVNTLIIFKINKRNISIGYKLSTFCKILIFSWGILILGVFPSYVIFKNEIVFANVMYKIIIATIYSCCIWIITKKYVHYFTGTNNMKELIFLLKKGDKSV